MNDLQNSPNQPNQVTDTTDSTSSLDQLSVLSVTGRGVFENVQTEADRLNGYYVLEGWGEGTVDAFASKPGDAELGIDTGNINENIDLKICLLTSPTAPTVGDLFSRRINSKPFETFYPAPMPAVVCYSVVGTVKETSPEERLQWLSGLYEWARLVGDQEWALAVVEGVVSAWESLNEEDAFVSCDIPYQPFAQFSRGELATIYMAQFFNRRDVWGKQYVGWDGVASYACQKPDMDTHGGKYLYEPVTLDLLRRHFLGEVTCATYAIDEHSCSRWLCFDSDADDGELDRLEDTLRSRALHVIREARRPGRAGHLWVLFDAPVPVDLLMILGETMIKVAKAHKKSKAFPKGIELFPGSETGLTQVRAPLGINLKPEAHNARGWFDGPGPDIICQLEWLASQPLNSAKEVIREVERYRQLESVIKKPPLPSQHSYSGNYQRMNILEHVACRQVGRDCVGRCPACAAVGQDTHEDNLRSTPDGFTFCCVEGGPGAVHKTSDIIRAIRQRPVSHAP